MREVRDLDMEGLLEDVAGAEPDRGRAAVDVDPLVVGVRDVECPSVLVGVAVRVTDERSLPLLCDVWSAF
jgi:hypothetical protein